MASRLLTWSLNRLARQWCYNVAQFESEMEYVVRVAPEYTEEEDADRPGFEQAKEVPVAFSGKDLLNGKSIEQGLKYNLKFAEFSSLPASMQEDKQMAMELFAAGILDEEDLLLSLDWPNARYIAKKAKERKGKEREAAAQQAQMAPPGAPPGMPPEGAPEQPVPQGQMDAAQMPPELMDAVNMLVDQGVPPDQAVQAVMAQAEEMM